MADDDGFGDNRTESARPYQPRHSRDQMNKQDEEVPHRGNRSIPPSCRIWAVLPIRIDTFSLHQGGPRYRRLVGCFQRIFGTTIFFGTDSQRVPAAVVHQIRFSFMAEARIWYPRDLSSSCCQASART